MAEIIVEAKCLEVARVGNEVVVILTDANGSHGMVLPLERAAHLRDAIAGALAAEPGPTAEAPTLPTAEAAPLPEAEAPALPTAEAPTLPTAESYLPEA